MRVPARSPWLRRLAGWAVAGPRAMWESPASLDAYALVHAASVAGDALTAIAMADSIFFSIPVGEASYRVALYLALTLAPLAVAAPLLVPLLDRGTFRRAVTCVAALGRAITVIYAALRVHSLLLFPAVFVVLVLSKVHGVTRNGLIAAYARKDAREGGDDLVGANARLARVGAVAALLASVPGVIALKLGGPAACLYTAAASYALCAGLSLRLLQPPPDPAPLVDPDAALRRGRMTSVATAAAGAGALRGAQGFLVLLLAFAVRRAGEPVYWLGLLALVAVAGGFLADLVGPHLAHGVREESIVLGSLLAAGTAALFTADVFSLFTLAIFTALASAATELGRLSFQSLIQREAPGGMRGRVFVRYEVAFQLAWVTGALLAAILPIPFRLGVLILAGFYLVVGVVYVFRSRRQRGNQADRRQG